MGRLLVVLSLVILALALGWPSAEHASADAGAPLKTVLKDRAPEPVVEAPDSEPEGDVARPTEAAADAEDSEANKPGPTGDATRGRGARRLSHRSRSQGYPFQGRLQRGVQLRESRYLRHVTEYAAAGNHYGTWELVQLLERAAYRVSRRLPGAKLSVGELSREGGGRIPGHASHQNGRDADVSFYMLDGRGRPHEPFAFAAFDANGRGTGPNRGLTFDDARNWELVAKLVADGDARIQFIFVANHLKQRLLREGRRRGAPASVLARAERVLVQPAEGNTHENHFHVRIYCSPGNRPACRDRAPFHPWSGR